MKKVLGWIHSSFLIIATVAILIQTTDRLITNAQLRRATRQLEKNQEEIIQRQQNLIIDISCPCEIKGEDV